MEMHIGKNAHGNAVSTHDHGLEKVGKQKKGLDGEEIRRLKEIRANGNTPAESRVG